MKVPDSLFFTRMNHQLQHSVWLRNFLASSCEPGKLIPTIDHSTEATCGIPSIFELLFQFAISIRTLRKLKVVSTFAVYSHKPGPKIQIVEDTLRAMNSLKTNLQRALLSSHDLQIRTTIVTDQKIAALHSICRGGAAIVRVCQLCGTHDLPKRHLIWPFFFSSYSSLGDSTCVRWKNAISKSCRYVLV